MRPASDRHAEPGAVDAVVARMAADRGGDGGVLADTEVGVDRSYVLASVFVGQTSHAASGATTGH